MMKNRKLKKIHIVALIAVVYLNADKVRRHEKK